MPRIAFELDLPEALAKAAAEQGLLSSQAVTELIKREVAQSSAAPSFRRQSWMEGIVSPNLLGQGRILVDDARFMAPIETEWESAGKQG